MYRPLTLTRGRRLAIPLLRRAPRSNGKLYSADENALIALHKMRTRMGSPAEIKASKAWLRSQGLTGLFGEPLL